MNFHHMNPADNPLRDADEALVDFWDYSVPDWYTNSLDPETRDTVDYADVTDPEWTVVMHTFGGDHRGLIFGAFE